MKMETSISASKRGQHHIRGKSLTDLIAGQSFTEVIFLLWRGNLPTKKEVRLLDSILVAAVEHGVSVPSLYVPRVSASVGNPMHVALAAGLLSIGTRHGGAIEAAAAMILSPEPAADIVRRHLNSHTPIPGFGHRLYKKEDPRAAAIYTQAKKLNLAAKYFPKAYDIQKELKKQKGKAIPLNIDGAMAAAILELGFDWRLGEAVFSLARLVGMAAHVHEEEQQDNPYYRLEE